MTSAIFGICLSFVLVEILNLKTYLPKKPFNCGVCMSGWLTLVIALIESQDIFWMFPAMVGYIFMEKILYKL